MPLPNEVMVLYLTALILESKSRKFSKFCWAYNKIYTPGEFSLYICILFSAGIWLLTESNQIPNQYRVKKKMEPQPFVTKPQDIPMILNYPVLIAPNVVLD